MVLYLVTLFMYKNNSCSGEISLDYIRSGLQVSWLYHQSRFWCLFFVVCFGFFFLFQKLDSDVTCNIRCWLSLVVPLCVLGAVQSTCNYIVLWLHRTGLFHPTWCYNFYNPGQKSLWQYCNIHIFMLFLGSLLKQCILFETVLQFSLPHTIKGWNSEKNSGYTRPTLFAGWGEGLGLCELENALEMQKCPKTFVHDCVIMIQSSTCDTSATCFTELQVVLFVFAWFF